MPAIRLKAFSTTLTAPGTTVGVLSLADTSGLTRRSCVSVDDAVGNQGWRLEIVRVVDGTHVVARLTGMVAGQKVGDLSAIPNGAVVQLEEQWVNDLYQDDVPANIALPVRSV